MKPLIQPALRGDDFLKDAETARRSPDKLHIWWLGQSGFLIIWRDRSLLFDPYLSDSLTDKYAGTDKPHVRMTARVIEPERLGFVGVATSSHNHTDHLDAASLNPIRRVNPNLGLIIPEANRSFVAERLGCDREWPTGLDAGKTVEVAGLRVTGIPAAHEDLERDGVGRHRYLGYVVEVGPWTVYHSGDTVRYDGMAELLAPFRIDVAMLPINGRAPERRVAGNMNGPEAARLAVEAGIRTVIPCHYDMFTFNTASPYDFQTEAARLRQAVRILKNGERLSLAVSPD